MLGRLLEFVQLHAAVLSIVYEGNVEGIIGFDFNMNGWV